MYDRITLVLHRVAGALSDRKNEEGQTTVEYAIIVALVIALAVAAFAVLNPSITSFMAKVGQAVTNHLP